MAITPCDVGADFLTKDSYKVKSIPIRKGRRSKWDRPPRWAVLPTETVFGGRPGSVLARWA